MPDSSNIGGAIQALHDLYCRAMPGNTGSWDSLASLYFINEGSGVAMRGSSLKAIPARVGGPDEARSWPCEITETRYCALTKKFVYKILKNSENDCVALAQLVRQSLNQRYGLSDSTRNRLEQIELSADKSIEEVSDLFDELFHSMYKEADENRKRLRLMGRSRLRERGRDTGSPGSGAHPSTGLVPLTPESLARELGGGVDGLPPVPRCFGMGGVALLERLLPRTLYLACQEELGALAAGPDSATAARISLALTEEGGTRMEELVERSHRLVEGGVDCRLLFALEERFFMAQPEGPVQDRARRAVDHFADREPGRILAALFLLSLTGMRGTIVALSSQGA